MNYKSTIYKIIRYPLIFLLLRTPLINILKNNFRYHRSNKNILLHNLNIFFQREYFNNLKNKKKMRELTDSTLKFGEGRKWAEYYYNKNILNIQTHRTRRVGLKSLENSSLIYKKIIDFIKINNLEKNKDVYILQIGSCSGRDLEFFYNIFPELNFISTDINNEILDFQKEKYRYKNFNFYKCYAENISKCIVDNNIQNKIVIIFSSGSLQYVNPNFLIDFFNELKKFKNMNFFLYEPISLSFIKNSNAIYKSRGNISFSYRYDQYCKDFKIIEKKLLTPYAKNNILHKDTGHYFLHILT